MPTIGKRTIYKHDQEKKKERKFQNTNTLQQKYIACGM